MLVKNNKAGKKMELFREELENFTFQKEVNSLDKDLIFTLLENLAEKIAYFLFRNDKNRIKFHEIEEFAFKKLDPSEEDEIRIEWKNLYFLCMLLGLKIETNILKLKLQAILKMLVRSQATLVGFRHETYKNYLVEH